MDMKNAIQRLYHNNVTIKALVVVSSDGRVRSTCAFLRE